MPKRTQPLTAPGHAADHDAGGASESRLRAGVRSLRVTGSKLRLGERTLMILGGVFVPVGLIMVWLGWRGASQTPNLYEQIPYMISGGLLGIALVFLGGFCYFAHWLTEIVKEQRSESRALLEAIGRLEETVRREAGNERVALANTAGNGTGGRHVDPLEERRPLVATGKGTMAHRPDCPVVQDKAGLREVTRDDGLAPCKLCDPYGADASTHALN